MIDGLKIVQAFNKVSESLFNKNEEYVFLSAAQWHALTSDKDFLERLEQSSKNNKQLARWTGNFGNITTL